MAFWITIKWLEFLAVVCDKTVGLFEGKTILVFGFIISQTPLLNSAMARESHGPHIHGIAHMALASEGKALAIQFESPAVNVLGFETQATTQAQTEAVERIRLLLSTPTNVLSFNDKQSLSHCTVGSVTVDVAGEARETADTDSKEHGEEYNHVHQKHHDHTDLDSSHGDDEGHSEVTALYEFACDDKEPLRTVAVTLFEHFPGIEKIQVNWVTDIEQGEAILTQQSPIITLASPR